MNTQRRFKLHTDFFNNVYKGGCKMNHEKVRYVSTGDDEPEIFYVDDNTVCIRIQAIGGSVNFDGILELEITEAAAIHFMNKFYHGLL